MVTVAVTGCMFVEAESEDKAREIADRQTADTVSWSDDWQITDVEPADSF